MKAFVGILLFCLTAVSCVPSSLPVPAPVPVPDVAAKSLLEDVNGVLLEDTGIIELIKELLEGLLGDLVDVYDVDDFSGCCRNKSTDFKYGVKSQGISITGLSGATLSVTVDLDGKIKVAITFGELVVVIGSYIEKTVINGCKTVAETSGSFVLTNSVLILKIELGGLLNTCVVGVKAKLILGDVSSDDLNCTVNGDVISGAIGSVLFLIYKILYVLLKVLWLPILDICII